MRRVLGLVVSIAVVSTPLFMSSPARAVSTVTTVCGGLGPTLSFATPSLSLTVGDVIPIQGVNPSDSLNMTSNGATGPSTISGISIGNFVVVAASGWIDAQAASGPCSGQTARLTFTAVGGSTGGSSGLVPAPVVQQFGKPAVGTCDEAASESLNWGGAASGAWGESWAQWMNGGLGGAVCTRTLEYSSVLGAWVAR